MLSGSCVLLDLLPLHQPPRFFTPQAPPPPSLSLPPELLPRSLNFSLPSMASCTAPTWVAAGLPKLASCSKQHISSSPAHVSFLGLRSASKVDALSFTSEKSFASQTLAARSSARVRCDVNPALIISLSTGAVLFLGRFVFLPFQRAQVAKAGLPTQNGVTHLEAGDSRAAEVSSFLKTNDPAGFTIVDVLAWGAIGHAIGFFILATASNGYDPTF